MSSAVARSSPLFSPARVTLGYEWTPPPSSPLQQMLRRRLSSGLRASLLKEEYCSTAADQPCSIRHHFDDETRGKSSLKRKRPMKIDIPVLQDIGLVEKIDPDVGIVEEGIDHMFSVYCKRGRRRHQMEDRYMKSIDTNMDVFGIFDGHGGVGAAEFVSRNIDRYLMKELAEIGEEEMEIMEAVRTAYMKVDSCLLKEDVAGGTCGVTALIRGNDLVVSNAGDCRAVLSREGMAVAVTDDHKPSRQDERDRIERMGGYVDCYNGIWRLQGTLAVSRGFGDPLLKEYVTAEPETRIIKLKPEHEFLIMASDGLWDKMTNQEAVDVARPMCIGSANGSVLTACRRLVELSISRGSADDVSVMIIPLGKLKSFSGIE